MKVIDLKMQQMEEAAKEVVGTELQILYQNIYQKIRDRKSLTEEDRRLIQEQSPDFYEMIKSLERDQQSWRQRLESCGSKEEVWLLLEDCEEEIRLGASTIESNPMVPWEKKLEYTMFKDTKISVIEELVEEFSRSSAYEELPEKAAGEDGVEDSDEKESEEKAVQPPREQEMQYAKAKASYEDLKRSHKEGGQGEAQLPVSFEAKG